MKITKLGHCCMVIEVNGTRIMTDPGAPSYSGATNNVNDISAIIITHEHQDHLHIDSLRKILDTNKNAVVITNTAVGKLLSDAQIPFIKVEEGQSHIVEGIHISGFGNTHAEIYDEFGQVQNTGYMIDSLCYPGDAFHIPNHKVDILALPVAGPWMRIKDAIDYAIKVNPRIAFPVHDAIIKDFATFLYTIPTHFLSQANIGFKKLEIGKEEEI